MIARNSEKHNSGSLASVDVKSGTNHKNDNYVNKENTRQNPDRCNTTGRTMLDIRRYKNQKVHAHPKPGLCIGMSDAEITLALSKLISLSHENILRFVGVILDCTAKCVLTNVAPKGSLYSLIESGELELTQDFKISLLLDVAKGMNYIHRSTIGLHGLLSSRVCFLDSKFTCKIGNYWSNLLANILDDDADTEYKLWMAPEVLRYGHMSPKADVYSFGVITQEVLLRNKPYYANEPPLNVSEIVKLVSTIGSLYRPKIAGFSEDWNELADHCWKEEPSLRPTFGDIQERLVKLSGGKEVSVVESMLHRLEAHTKHLEDIVYERSLELESEKLKAETLICELLPPSVFAQLKKGKQVQPETFKEATLFFSDIEGFTSIAGLASPMEIVSLLNRLYMFFDNVIVKYDVYKVATIGDAYIVVSGVPVRNGNRHAGEIASMALELIAGIEGFEIDHMPGSYLKMRVGLHSGPCVAAITGLKMPRYLLFGETVNTGTKIEAFGETMKIHLSDTTSKLLAEDDRFVLLPRSEKIDVPGYGIIQTSWLAQKNTQWFVKQIVNYGTTVGRWYAS